MAQVLGVIRREQRPAEGEEKRLLEDVGRVGPRPARLYDWVNAPPAPSVARVAVPTLVTALRWVKDPGLREGIVRIVKGGAPTTGVLEPLATEFEALAPTDPTRGWVVGDTLAALAPPAWRDRVRGWILRPDYGASRQMLLVWYGRHGGPDAGNVLCRLLQDPSVQLHAASALRSCGGPTHVEALRAARTRAPASVQRKMETALRAIEKREARPRRAP